MLSECLLSSLILKKQNFAAIQFFKYIHFANKRKIYNSKVKAVKIMSSLNIFDHSDDDQTDQKHLDS